MTPAFLFTVEEAFQISGRGCVLVPRHGEEPAVRSVRVGDPIRLVKPDGEVTDTQIAGIEMLNFGGRKPPEKGFAPILLPAPLTKDEVPSGTRVYQLGSSKS